MRTTKKSKLKGPRQPPRNMRVPLTSFLRFGTLPVELRLDIWHKALPGPRIVDLKTRILALRCQNRQSRYGFSTDCPAPVLLYVCRESYEVVAKSYTLMFATTDAFATIWFNPKIDTLFINEETFQGSDKDYNIRHEDWGEIGCFNLIGERDLKKVENICVNPRFLHSRSFFIYDREDEIEDILNLFPNVTSVSFVGAQVRGKTWNSGMAASTISTLAFLPTEDYYLALARLELESCSKIELESVEFISNTTFLSNFRSWILLPEG
ncbi:hypothetical protein HYALB_00005825 [Hymenoscyphus albidus]|uniref:2EXR domain-containing protein n=1 Tax=Hymenoscyphus albidus TaxID=595503 RepID=A0A9N9Q4K9_9HELO|nr:hypothetical protein HYALB_00005825 [Hymenoscyphus albidus]